MLKERYYIGIALGQGGFGITYAAFDTYLNRKVAVKEFYPNGFVNRNSNLSTTVISSGNPSDDVFFTKGRQRFLEEASVLAEFSAVDGVVNVEDCFRENNTVYIVMDFLEGITLKQYLQRNGQLSVENTFRLLMPVMKALREIHRKKLIHRDISPDNIMLTQQGDRLRVTLIDFGAARHFSAATNKSLTVMLKPGFAPIEQYGSKDEQGAWTDVYALCATIYKCITGVTPDASPERVGEDQLAPPSRLGVQIDAKTEWVIMKGLSLDPDDRYQTVDAMLHDLLTDDVVPDRKPPDRKLPDRKPPRNAGGKKKKKNKIIAAFAAAAAVLAAVVIVYAVLPKLTARKEEENGTTAGIVAAGNTESVTSVEEDPFASFVSKDFIDPVNGWQEYDDLIARIKSETDHAKRIGMMHSAEDVLMSSYCVMPLYYYNDIYMQRDYVEGVYSNSFETKFFLYATLSNGSGTLRLHLGAEPDSLDPAFATAVDSASMAANSFAGLYAYDETGGTVPACAEGYTVSDDGLTYTVKLKEGLKWSDGSALTAADFAYAWKRAADPATAADNKYLFSGFAGYDKDDIRVTAVDDTTLKFVLSAPCAYMEELMALTAFYPVKREAVEAAAGWETDPDAWCREAGFVSNGAYVCTSWDHDDSVTYEKNPYFYNADKVSVDRLEYMLSSESSAIFNAYKNGRLDFMDSAPEDAIESLREDNHPDFHIADVLGTCYAAFNANSKLFEGKTPAQAACMREAISLLIDREFICDSVGRTGQIAANTFIPPGMADGNGGYFRADDTAGYYDAYAVSNDHDATVAKARELLETAGYTFGDDGKLSADTPIDVEYLTNDSPGYVAIARLIQGDLEEIGVSMTIRAQEWAVFAEESKAGDFDIACSGWLADFNDPINMLEMWVTSSDNNVCQFGRFAGWDA